MKNLQLILYWISRLFGAFLMFQTLFFKFTGAEESIEIFTKVGMEPVGRYLVGILELLASVLLLINPLVWIGAALGAGLMAGAIVMHLFILGIEVHGDHGLLFSYALIILTCCLYALSVNKDKVVLIWKRTIGSKT